MKIFNKTKKSLKKCHKFRLLVVIISRESSAVPFLNYFSLMARY